MKYLEELIENCTTAMTVRPSRTLVAHTFDEARLSFGDIKTGIYVIEEMLGNPENTFEKYRVEKASSDRAYAKANGPSPIMYIGSSTTGVLKRLNQHFGFGPKSTYALHLSQWFEGQCKITVYEYEVSRDVLQLIEDAMASETPPAFGKRGPNGR